MSIYADRDRLITEIGFLLTEGCREGKAELAAGLTLGDDPMIDRFGGNNFEVDTSGHSGYWDGGKSLDNQGRIIVGRPPSIVPKLHDSPPPPP
ncbi:hypothetical protein P3T27_006173 [Kitasatospora sp. MAA19]|uniref:hypothetical protein n=1 Tax=Kitasatospora sp. MAA19 TaxID=3035090 RepID=UPI0024763B64|nr:hypothetical protein [Kitasatospora sp. MAA19]MDH6709427.1 hypothetical protein [Kitasatospora sp. MAA19]